MFLFVIFLFFYSYFFKFKMNTDCEPDFESRQVQIRKGKWVTEEFEMLEFLGRYKNNINTKENF